MGEEEKGAGRSQATPREGALDVLSVREGGGTSRPAEAEHRPCLRDVTTFLLSGARLRSVRVQRSGSRAGGAGTFPGWCVEASLSDAGTCFLRGTSALGPRRAAGGCRAVGRRGDTSWRDEEVEGLGASPDPRPPRPGPQAGRGGGQPPRRLRARGQRDPAGEPACGLRFTELGGTPRPPPTHTGEETEAEAWPVGGAPSVPSSGGAVNSPS